MSPSRESERILSIQSHVSFGYVGGKAAVFPLQLLGYDVDVINTVNFSNHSGYGRFGGSRTNAAELKGLFEAMEENGFLYPTRLLTGYIPGAEALTTVADLAEKLQEKNPSLIYLLDPVIGDSGKVYVAADVIPVYRSLLKRATIITPNWFEVEVLTDTKMHDRESLQTALTTLHETYSVPHVVISSIPLKPWLIELIPEESRPQTDQEFLLCITSSKRPSSSKTSPLSDVHICCIPFIPGYFSGVGDLFSALVLAHFTPSTSDPTSSASSTFATQPESPLAHATSLALTKTHAILQLTHDYASSLPAEDRTTTDEELDANQPERKIRRMKGRELRLIQGQDILRGTKDAMGEVRKMHAWEGFWAS